MSSWSCFQCDRRNKFISSVIVWCRSTLHLFSFHPFSYLEFFKKGLTSFWGNGIVSPDTESKTERQTNIFAFLCSQGFLLPPHRMLYSCSSKKEPFGPSDQIRSVAQSCPTLCDPMNRSTPGLAVHHQLPEFTQTHVHRVSDAIQPSHPLSSPSPPAPNPSQHQSLFQWVNSSHEVAKVLEFQL